MAALHALGPNELCDFMRLKSIVQTTDGNLATHLMTLEEAGYVKVLKDFVGRKPRTRIGMTREGWRAFNTHLEFLREIIGYT